MLPFLTPASRNATRLALIRFASASLAGLIALHALQSIPTGNAAEISALAAAVNSIAKDDLKRHVNVLADDSFEGRQAGSRGGHAASIYLRKHLIMFGLAPLGTDGDYFQYFGSGLRNVLGIHAGSDLRHEIVLVGAHYDHVGYGSRRNSNGPIGFIHNGADDNASGTAALLEVIEAFARFQVPTRRSIVFAFWDGEEQGLLGSKHYVDNPPVTLDRTRIFVNMDMVGRLADKKLKVYGTRTGYGLRRLLSQQNFDRDLHLDFTWEMQDNSDHYTFFQRDVPVLMLHTGLHDDYHRPSDDANKVDTAGMQRVVRLLFSAIHELANVDQPPAFRAQSRYESPATQRGLQTAPVPSPKRFGVSWHDVDGSDDGLQLSRVALGSPAHQAGLQAGDRILRFGKHRIASSSDLRARVVSADSPVAVLVRRGADSEPREMMVQLAGKPQRLGITWQMDDAEPGVVIVTQVETDSAAARAGLQRHDRVYDVAGHTFRNGDEFRELAMSLPFPLALRIERNGQLLSKTLAELGELAVERRSDASGE